MVALVTTTVLLVDLVVVVLVRPLIGVLTTNPTVEQHYNPVLLMVVTALLAHQVITIITVTYPVMEVVLEVLLLAIGLM